MKVLVFLLVLGNLLLYALTNGLLGRPDNPDAGRIDQQIAVDRIRLVSRGEAPASKAPELVAAKPADSCLRWEALSLAEAERLEGLLKENFSALNIKRQTLAGEGSSWWVFIPPLAGKAEAERKTAELRRLNVSDYFVIQDNNANRFAISLGLFSSEKGGQDRLAELRAKGVKSARVTIRPGKETQYTLEASGTLPDKEALSQLPTSLLPKNPPLNCR